MSTIRERLEMVRTNIGLTATAFGNAIGVSQSYVSQFSKFPEKNVSEAVIIGVCREFNVNELWLRTGEGDMFMPKTVDDEIDAFCGDVKKLDRDDPRWIIMRLLAKLPESDWIAIADIIRRLREE